MVPFLFAEAPKGCRRCPRLVSLRRELRRQEPEMVERRRYPPLAIRMHGLAIVGLAPGKEGANRTGRPFTGDASGDTLFATLDKLALSEGRFESPD